MKLWVQMIVFVLACLGARGSEAQQVDFVFDKVLSARDTDLPYSINLSLSAIAATRVRVDALLDLREIQKTVPERLADNALVDGCGFQVKLDELNIIADKNTMALDSLLKVTRFDCGRISKNDFRRGKEITTFSAQVSTAVAVEISDNCAYLKIPDLTLTAPESTRERLLEEQTLNEVKSFLLAAIDLVLSEAPICPELPPELASLDPNYKSGGPKEIDDGGLGVNLSGSLDVSPSTIIDILLVLQREDHIPPSP